jgi:hypothetical protein
MLLLLCGCDRLFGLTQLESDAGGDSWWDDAWQRRRKLTFQHLGGSEDLFGFQVLVELDATRIDFAEAGVAGEDIRFVDADGTLLPHEIELWDASHAFVWVRVPQIDAMSSSDHIWMYYGNPAASDGQAREQVWAEYHGVWHLAQQGMAMPDEYVDSSPQRKHARGGVGIASAVPVRTTGPIGYAQQFDGGDDVIGLEAATSSTFNFTAPALTLEAWVNPASSRTDWAVAIGFAGYDDGYRLELDMVGRVALQITGMTYHLESAFTISSANWHYLVGTYDGSAMRIFIDGAKSPTELPRTGGLDATIERLLLGRAYTSGQPYDFPLTGSLDELRVANVARSAAWLEAQYRSMTDAFVTFGDEAAR